MSYVGGEAVCNTILTALEARLPALLSLVNSGSEADDATRGQYIELPVPLLYLFGRRAVDPLEYPAVLCWEESEEIYETGPGSGIGGNDPHNWTEGERKVIIAALLTEGDEEILERQLARYRAAIRRWIAENPVLMVANRSHTLTMRRAGRESYHGFFRSFAPGMRGIVFDCSVTAIEDF